MDPSERYELSALNENQSSAERLRRWNRAMNPMVIVAAILPLGPLVSGEDPTEGPGLIVALASWVVFAVDFAVRTRLDAAFIGTWKGRLYLGIVVVTFPVYALIPGLEEADLLVVSRLGWVAVLAISGIETVRNTRVLVHRVGVAGLYASPSCSSLLSSSNASRNPRTASRPSATAFGGRSRRSRPSDMATGSP